MKKNENDLKEFSKKYLDLLTGKFKGINLTRITTPEEFYYKQIEDSVYPIFENNKFIELLNQTKKLVDVGFGGGFPILPLAYLLPEVDFIGIEARNKKASTVSEIANDLDIKNARLYHGRIEEFFFDEDVVVTFKAVGKIEEFLSKINTNKTLYIYFYKGPNLHELEDLSKISTDEWELIEEKFYPVDGTQGRILIGFKNKVPRGTNSLKYFKFSQLH